MDKIVKVVTCYLLCAVCIIPLAVADAGHDLYLGLGTGFNLTQNYGLTKTYQASRIDFGQNYVASQYLGNVSGYSMPLGVDLGYKFSPYVGVEFNYVYSGDQTYKQASNDPVQTNFWGSQNTFGLSIMGFWTALNDFTLKARVGLAFSMDTMTTFAGDPGSKSFTSELGLGGSWLIVKDWSLDFDYINYGLLAPMQLQYKAPSSAGPNLGVINNIISNVVLFSVNYHI